MKLSAEPEPYNYILITLWLEDSYGCINELIIFKCAWGDFKCLVICWTADRQERFVNKKPQKQMALTGKQDD